MLKSRFPPSLILRFELCLCSEFVLLLLGLLIFMNIRFIVSKCCPFNFKWLLNNSCRSFISGISPVFLIVSVEFLCGLGV